MHNGEPSATDDQARIDFPPLSEGDDTRLMRLRQIGLAFARAATVVEVAAALLTEGMEALEAAAGYVCLRRSEDTEFFLVQAVGCVEESVAALARFPADAPYPLCDAVRVRQPLYLETQREFALRYPTLTNKANGGMDGAVIALPLLAEEQSLGGLVLAWREDRPFPSEERALMQILAEMGAAALLRTRFYHVTQGEVSARKEAEARMQETRQRNRQKMQAAPHVTALLYDITTQKTVFVSQRTTRMLGYAPDDLEVLEEAAIRDMTHPEDQPLIEGHLQRVKTLRDGETADVIYRLRNRHGEWRWLLSQDTVFLRDETGAARHIFSIATDITEQKRTEDDYAALSASGRCFIWYADVYEYEHPSYLNWECHIDEEAAQRFLPVKQAPGQSYATARYHSRVSEDRDRCDLLATASIRAGRSYSQEFRTITVDGIVRWLHEYVKVTVIEPGTRWRLTCFCTDITARKQAEIALRESEERLRLAMEAGNACAWEWNVCTGEVIWSEEYRHLFGAEPERCAFEAFLARVHPEGRERVEAYITALREGCALTEEDFRILRSDGEERWMTLKAEVIERERDVLKGRPLRLVGIIADITERKRHQQQIEELNARLRRAMAESHHRIKNHLQSLTALVEMQEADSDGRVSVSVLERIQRHVRTLATLHDLLTSDSKVTEGEDDISLSALLHHLIPMLQTALGEREIRLQAKDGRITIKQAGSFALLVNELLVNAAKHGKTLIEVSLKQKTEDEGEKAEVISGLSASDEVLLEVCDDGPGFPPDFNPRTAAHTGLELIESLGRWDLHGDIRYENRPEGGGRVVVTFPLSAGEV